MKTKKAFTLMLALLTASFMFQMQVEVVPAHSHSVEIQLCIKNIHASISDKVDEGVLEGGVFWYERYQIQGEKGTQFITTYSNIKNMERNSQDGTDVLTYNHYEHPLFYILDFNGDGKDDAVYIDANVYDDPGVYFSCDKLYLYVDLRYPKMDDYNNRSGGKMSGQTLRPDRWYFSIEFIDGNILKRFIQGPYRTFTECEQAAEKVRTDGKFQWVSQCGLAGAEV